MDHPGVDEIVWHDFTSWRDAINFALHFEMTDTDAMWYEIWLTQTGEWD